MTRVLFSIFLLTLPVFLIAQSHQRKNLEALRTAIDIEIDGALSEDAWQFAPTAKDFLQREPLNGRPASFDTHVKILYDDQAIYVGAHILDPNPDSLWQELKSRDIFGLADYFGVVIDPYNDGLNGLAFFVSVRNVQIDYKIDGQDNEDYDWDAVWISDTKIVADGWIAEIKIPYSALRFPKTEIQKWGINFQRNIQRFKEVTSWNFIDATISGSLQQSGELIGIEQITPPLRLSGTPYFSTFTEHNSETGNWKNGYNIGMDIKAGLSESFTLDVTLIPDFGQVESDDKIYSLSPYEVFYEEKRPFFTEGTELFNKGNIFYSRRIGSTADGFHQVQNQYDPEQIIDNPENEQLINAIKLSGKTNRGLGIGVFNAMTANTWAKVKDSTGNEQRILTAPFTNYNMFVFEQALWKNSSISIYNTNVYKPDNRFAANVSGTEFRLRDKSNHYQTWGNINISQHYTSDNSPKIGEYAQVGVEKVSGNFLAETWFKYVSDDYDPNDMGFLSRNNEIAQGINLKYNIYEPFGKFLNLRSRLYINQYYLDVPRKFNQLLIGMNGNVTTEKQFTTGLEFSFRPLGFHDYFEPRVPGYYYVTNPNYSFGLWTSPDYRKTFLVDLRFGLWNVPSQDLFNWWGSIKPRWRASNNFLVIPELFIDYNLNNIGYVKDSTDYIGAPAIIFGRRDIIELTSSLEASYVFSQAASLSFRARHYWLRVNYLAFYDLQKDGTLIPNLYQNNENFVVNAFNIDMVFKWDFAPGSELLLIWKNAIFSNDQQAKLEEHYWRNLKNTFEAPISNSFSIKLLYYLDWQYFKSGSNKKSEGFGALGQSIRNLVT
jgi:hypothetical protein